MKSRSLPLFSYRKMRFNYVLPYAFLFLIVISGLGLMAQLAQPQVVNATVPKLIYYQGKISKTSDGTNIANGNYSMQFKIYSASSGGSLLWTETWDGGTSQVAFTNGLFSVALGTYTSLDTIDFSTGALYLTANFNPGAGYDGEMSPRQQITSAAFAIAANSVLGDGRIDIAYAPATTTNPGAKINYSPSVSSSNNALNVTAGSNVTGPAVNIVQGGSGGAVLIGATALGGSTQTYLGANPGSFSGNFLDFQVGSTSKFTVTNTGAVTAGIWNGTIITSAYGGTGNGFTKFSGPASTEKTFTLPNASATILTSNALVTVGQGGIGIGTLASNGILYGNGTGAVQALAVNAGATLCLQQASSAAPTWGSCGGGGGISLAPGSADSTASTNSIENITATGLTGNNFINLKHTTSTFTGTGLLMDFANATGTFSGNFEDYRVNTVSKFTISSAGSITKVGPAITGGAGLTISSTSADLALNTTTSGNITFAPASTGSVQMTLGTTTGTGTTAGLSLASSTLTSGSLADLTVTGSGALGSQKALNVSTSGAVAGTSTTYGGYFSNTHTGGTAVNVGLYATASGATGANYAAIFESGNVGIGTTTPSTALVVSSGSDTDLQINSTVHQTAVLTFADTNNRTFKLGIYNPNGDHDFAILDTTGAAVNRLRIDLNGNVGIGPSVAVDWLSITSAIRASATRASLNLTNTALSSGSASGTYLGANASSFSGDFINLQNSGTSVFTVSATSTLVKSASANAFQIQNSTSTTPVVNVNTSALSSNNLIVNASFEQNINNWVAKGTPTAGPVWDNTASNAQFGNGTLKFVGHAVGDGAQYSYPFAPSTAYGVSFWAKTASGTATLRLDRQDNGSDVGGCTDSAVTTTWTNFTCTFTTGSTINTSTSNIFIKQNAAGTPTVYIDGFTMIPGSTFLSYSNPGANIQVDNAFNNITLNASQNPDIQPWQLNSNALPSGRRAASSITANGYAYFIGGTTANGSSGAPVTTVNYARMNADGSISSGAWSAAANTLPVALYGHSSVQSNGYLYVIGGCSDSSTTAACTTPVTTVYYSKLNSDGTVGTWQTAPSGIPAARGFGSLAVVNGFIYYFGGYNSTAQTTTYSARLSADGNITGWTTTGVTAFGTGRYGQTTIVANGKIYTIGGCSDAGATCGTAITTVEYASPANDGTLGAWTATTSLPTATGFHNSVILNGYIFNIGGRQSAAPVATVNYSKFDTSGSLGIWVTSGYALPAVRQQSTSLFVNSYIYNMGGFDGTTTLPTSIHFASGPRVSIFGGLDLVGLSSQVINDYGGGGTLTAGNTRVVGDLRVDGFADLNNGLSVDSAINLNAVSAVSGQNIFNINNLNSNSIFNVRHMSTNFGALVTSGAFMQKNSYWGEEFNNGKLTACAPVGAAAGASINAWARGDGGGQGAAAACSGTANATVNGGELNASTATGGTTTFGSCSFASPGVTTANGVERITATSVNTVNSTANCVENLGGTTTTSNKIYLAANLPVIAIKTKPSTLPASTAASRVQIGLFPGDSASGTGVNSPANAIYFTNCSTWNNAAVPTGCSNTNWYGVTSGASAATVVTCSVGAATLTTNFSYLRIEVRSTTDVHFFADYNTTDGINESECGTGSATNITASALTPWMQAMYNGQAAATTALDTDYFRGWQDDNITPGQDSSSLTAPITVDPAVATTPEQQTGFDARAMLAKFMAMTEPESAAAQLQQIDTGVLTASSQIVSPTITANGLHIDSITATGNFISLMSDVSFIGRPYFNTDTAGFAQVTAGDTQVTINFDSPYLEQPIVNVGVSQNAAPTYKTETDPDKIKQMQADQVQAAQELFSAGIQYLVINKNENGFTIILNKPATKDLTFSWTAFAVKNAKISLSNHSESTTSNNNTSTGTVAGDSTTSGSSDSGSSTSSTSSSSQSSATDSSTTTNSSSDSIGSSNPLAPSLVPGETP